MPLMPIQLQLLFALCIYASLHHCIIVQLHCTLQYTLYSIQFSCIPAIMHLCTIIASLYSFTAPCTTLYSIQSSCKPAFMHLLHHCIIVQLHCTLHYVLTVYCCLYAPLQYIAAFMHLYSIFLPLCTSAPFLNPVAGLYTSNWSFHPAAGLFTQ